MSKKCSVSGCAKKMHAMGMCSMHRSRVYRRGCAEDGKQCHAPAEIRFFRLLDKLGDSVTSVGSPCWLWLGACHPLGYGQFGNGVKVVPAHRYSWELHNEEIPVGVHVLHKCDTPACVNPQHLFLGTSLDNARDKINKGRSGVAKLTAEAVGRIRRDARSQRVIAQEYGVSHSTIGLIKTNQTWTHL